MGEVNRESFQDEGATAMTAHHHAPTSAQVTANMITTALAGGLNMLVILVICFVLMPRVDRAIIESEENQSAIIENRRIMIENWKELESHRKVIKRLSDALDAAAHKAKQLEKKK